MNERRQWQQSIQIQNHDDDLNSHSIPSHHPHDVSSATSNASVTPSAMDTDGNTYHHPDPKRQRRNHRKRVHFAPTAEVYMLPTPMSSHQDTSYWYTEQDSVSSKIEMAYCSRVLRERQCLNVVENIAHHIATNIASDVTDESSSTSTSSLNDEACRSIDTFKQQQLPQERLLTRGIEHTISPTVLKLINLGRNAVILRVLREQERLRQQLQYYERQRIGIPTSDEQVQWRMSMALAQVSRESSLFAREWAVHKLMDE